MNLRIAITGIGVVSAAGGNKKDTADSLRRGERNAGTPSRFSSSLKYPVFEAKYTTAEKISSRTNRSLNFLKTALNEALKASDFVPGFNGKRCGVCIGTLLSNQLDSDDFYYSYKKDGLISEADVRHFYAGDFTEIIAAEYGCTGPRCLIANACSSGVDAIGAGMSLLRRGSCDIVIAGGVDELSGLILSGFKALGVASDELCAPFDRDRKGLNLGEGAGIMILEREEDVLSRGIKPHLFAAGYGSACDAYHITAPLPGGESLEFAIRRALDEAGIIPEDIGFINAHGTATIENDVIEGMVIDRVFGRGATVLSTKGYTGHTLGAAGAIEAVFSAIGLEEGWLPASAGFVNKDDRIPFAPINTITEVKKRFALSISLAFGGTNGVIVLEHSLN